jgi:glutathione synthase/RimK-type ligase-like ATP-grasp enzyme
VLLSAYNRSSGSIKQLTDAGEYTVIGGKSMTPRRTRAMLNIPANSTIINWGKSQFPAEVLDYSNNNGIKWFNHPDAVALWKDKGKVCDRIEGTHLLGSLFIEMTKDQSVAQEWLDSGYAVVCRTLLNASNGRGISVIDPEEGASVPTHVDNQRVLLYTKYFKKRREYRVHVAWSYRCNESRVLSVQSKRRRRDAEYDDTRIRNAHDTGAGSWVFIDEPLDDVPQPVLEVAKLFIQESAIDGSNQASQALDFAGLDIGYNQHYNQARIIEVNTAPGIGPRDAARFTEYFTNEQEHI